MFNISLELHRIVTNTTQTLHVPNFTSVKAAIDWRVEMFNRLDIEGWRPDLMQTVTPHARMPMVLTMISPCEKLKISVSINPPGAPEPPPSVPEVLGMIEKLL